MSDVVVQSHLDSVDDGLEIIGRGTSASGVPSVELGDDGINGEHKCE